jgi:hypothetical protein
VRLPVPGVEPGSLSPLRTCQIIPYGTTTPRCLHFTYCTCRPNMNPSGIRRHQGPVWNAEFRMSDNWCGRRRVDLVSAYAVAYRPSTLNFLAPQPRITSLLDPEFARCWTLSAMFDFWSIGSAVEPINEAILARLSKIWKTILASYGALAKLL